MKAAANGSHVANSSCDSLSAISPRVDDSQRGCYVTVMEKSSPSQLDKFKQAARELGADEDEKHWDDRLRKLAKVKPEPEKPE